jgi:hypothetical protein
MKSITGEKQTHPASNESDSAYAGPKYCELEDLLCDIERQSEDLGFGGGWQSRVRAEIAEFRHARAKSLSYPLVELMACLKTGNETAKDMALCVAALVAEICEMNAAERRSDSSRNGSDSHHVKNTIVGDATQMAFQTPAAETDPVPGVGGNGYGRLPQPEVHPLLNELGISEFNPRHKFPPDPGRLERMQRTIREHGLLQAVLIARVPPA